MKTRPLRVFLAFLLCAPLLSACAKGTTASVNVLGVNYTEKEFNYRVEDPNDPKNTAGGELVDSYSAGGIQCCFNLPRQWHPGIKVRIFTTQWDLPPPPNDDLKNLKEIRATVEAEVPKYVDGKAGDLWVVRNADNSYMVVSSNYQPDHAKWPGPVKGWPVPSLEYRRVLWARDYQEEKNSLASAKESIAQLKSDPDALFLSNWEFGEKYRRSEIAGFSNYKDPKYQAKIRAEVLEFLDIQEKRVKRMEEIKP